MSHVSVLLLDAAWRVDRVINEQRACELLLDGVVVEASPEIATIMRSPSIEVPIPSVIARIGKLRSNQSSIPSCSSRNVRSRDRHVCQFVVDGMPCSRVGDSVDHLTPRSIGGPSSWTNLVAACRRHNGIKQNRRLDDLGWRLRRAPYVPTRHELLTVRLSKVGRPEWHPFLATA